MPLVEVHVSNHYKNIPLPRVIIIRKALTLIP